MIKMLLLCLFGLILGLGSAFEVTQHDISQNFKSDTSVLKYIIKRVEDLEIQGNENHQERNIMKKQIASMVENDEINQKEIGILQRKLATADMKNQQKIEILEEHMELMKTKENVNQNEIEKLKKKVVSMETIFAEKENELRSLRRKMESTEKKCTKNKFQTIHLKRKIAFQQKLATLKTTKLQSEIAGLKSLGKNNANATTKTGPFNQINQDSDGEMLMMEGGANIETDHVEETMGAVTYHEHSRRQAGPTNPVAFYAYITPDVLYNISANSNILFDNVTTNVGNAYHPQHGFFRTSVAGTYVFFVTISPRTAMLGGRYYAYLSVSGTSYAKIQVNTLDQSSQTVIVHLKANVYVAVKNTHAGEWLLGDQLSTFSGFLLHPDFSGSPSLVG